jgi:hypothetical protein
MRAPRTLLLAAAVALLCLGASAQAELTQKGDLQASLQGGISPTSLPRSDFAPVGVRVAGGVKALHGTRLPQLRTITVAINRAGRLYDRGLPTCRVRSIQPATEAQARKVCAKAIVGSGRVTVSVRLPSQRDFTVNGTLLAFNGPRRGGKKIILAQIYAHNPPGAFVLVFTLNHHKGLYGTVMSTELPASAHGWAYLTFFEMKLGRRYTFRGVRRSYVSAACSAPSGFTKALFPFAKASYGFDDGQVLTTKITRTCRVAGP